MSRRARSPSGERVCIVTSRVLRAAVVLVLATTALAVDAETRRLAQSDDLGDRRKAAVLLATEGTAAAVKLLRTLIRDEHPWVRDSAVFHCAKLKDADAIAALEPLLRNADETTRRNAVAALGRTKSAQAGDVLRKVATKDKSDEVRRDAVAWLSAVPVTGDTLPVLAEAAADRSPMVRATALVTLDLLGEKEAGATHALALLQDDDEGVRCAAIWALARMGGDRLDEHIGCFRVDDGWRARAQAVETAEEVRDVRCLEVLIDLLAYDHRRVSTEAHQALRRVTGLQYGKEQDLWRAWLAEARKKWTPPETLKDLDEANGPSDTTVRYHGIEVATDGVVFAIDSSGSMDGDMEGELSQASRWGVALWKLRETIAEMPDGVRVNVLFFDDRVTMVFDEPRPLSDRVRKDVETFLMRRGPAGNTNVHDTLTEVLEMDGVDTLFLLGDGEPNRGAFVQDWRIRPYFWARNRLRRLRVHTISIGADKSGRALLEKLAKATGGRFLAY